MKFQNKIRKLSEKLKNKEKIVVNKLIVVSSPKEFTFIPIPYF